MKEEEIMARRRIGNINSRRYRGITSRMIEHMLDQDPFVYDITTNMPAYCWWCKNNVPDHETDCVWLALQETFGQEEGE